MYISLPSDASLKYFPNNIISNYTVKLPGELNYDREKYEVGLVSCNWTKSFHNIETTEIKVYDLTDQERPPKITTLPGKYYEDVQELLDEINKRINALIAEEDSFVSSDQNALVFKINEFGKVYFERLDHFSEISIELRDEIGVLVPFNFGKIVIDIHIKRKFL